MDYRYFLPNSEKIKRLRREKGWNQQELADKAKCNKRTIENAESGKQVTWNSLSLIATALEVEVKVLLAGEELSQPSANQAEAALFKPGSAPPRPSCFIGREDALRELKGRLGISVGSQSSATVQVLTAVRGWPGVGKTTLACELAHDPEIAAAFPDGPLWISLGQNPDLLSKLAAWGRALGTGDLLRVNSPEEASARLTALLRNKRMFIIVDDVWQPEHARLFQVGGRGCAMLITTRETSIAQDLVPPRSIYLLNVLSEDKALELLKEWAPDVVAKYPQQSRELVLELECLPLALHVAGNLLNVEFSYGFGVTELIQEIKDGAAILHAKPPVEFTDLEKETVPTVAALLQKSTDRLDPESRERYAFLGAFAPEPATFDLNAMKSVWEVDDPTPTVRILVNRGLLERVESGESVRYQMHALLVKLAASLCQEE